MKDVCGELKKKKAQNEQVALYSVCSSNTVVLEAAVRRVARSNKPIVIESTANQVNQDGGYTGLTPSDFVAQLRTIMERYGVDEEKILYGGDHLGPYPWRSEPASIAMTKAETLVRSYVASGAKKIHLDTSMALGDDPSSVLDPKTIAERSAILCVACEDEFAKLHQGNEASVNPLSYIIGTEVPVPGGEQEAFSDNSIKPTTKESLAYTLKVHQEAFLDRGLEDVWERVLAVVVQPGVDFDSESIIPYHRSNMNELKEMLQKGESVFFEAHSTDYQTTNALHALVEDGFIFLKVGPALTFAYRRALFALAEMAKEKGVEPQITDIADYMFSLMKNNQESWAPYYRNDSRETLLYSLSDRIRYYWDTPEARVKVEALMAAVSGMKFSTGLVHQYFPNLGDYGHLSERTGYELLLDSIEEELIRYEYSALGSERDISESKTI